MIKRTAVIFVTMACLFILQVSMGKAHANQIGLAVYPPTITLMTQAPINLKIPLRVKNTSDTELSVSVDFIPFLKTQAGGALPLYALDVKTAQNLKQSLENIVTLRDGDIPLSIFTLEPRQTRNLTLSVTIPKLYKSTDYYFSIRYIARENTSPPQTSNDSTQTIQNISVASNVLLGIGNKQAPQIRVSSFFPGSHILTSSSVPFLVGVKNNGSHFTKLTGDITITNILTGIKTVIPLSTADILRGGERYLTPKEKGYQNNAINAYKSIINPLLVPYIITYHSPLLLGIYKAELNLGEESDVVQKITGAYFVGIPLQMLTIFLALLAIFYLVKKRVGKIRNKVEI